MNQKLYNMVTPGVHLHTPSLTYYTNEEAWFVMKDNQLTTPTQQTKIQFCKHVIEFIKDVEPIVGDFLYTKKNSKNEEKRKNVKTETEKKKENKT